MPACEEWTPETRIPRIFTMSYTYEHSGTYLARVELGDGTYRLMSNPVTIVVR